MTDPLASELLRAEKQKLIETWLVLETEVETMNERLYRLSCEIETLNARLEAALEEEKRQAARPARESQRVRR